VPGLFYHPLVEQLMQAAKARSRRSRDSPTWTAEYSYLSRGWAAAIVEGEM